MPTMSGNRVNVQYSLGLKPFSTSVNAAMQDVTAVSGVFNCSRSFCRSGTAASAGAFDA